LIAVPVDPVPKKEKPGRNLLKIMPDFYFAGKHDASTP
jgi:hypothetical protein